MKKSIITLMLLVWFELGFAAGGNVQLLDAKINLRDRASLQHGGKLFVNYCLSCHSLSYMRYNRLGKDLGLSDKQVKENLIFVDTKIGSTMTSALNKEDAIRWFGVAPPDLSVVARSRGADWLYSYLLSFYEDPKRPLGVNNLVFPQVSMPHVLAPLQGVQTLVPDEYNKNDKGHELVSNKPITSRFQLKTAGSMDEAEYRRAARDLTNFLVYVGEPAQLDRYRLGFWVIIFLIVFLWLARSLYKEYWKDVH